LRDDRQLVREQEVVVPVDAPADRVLERQDAVRRASLVHRVEDLLEAVARDELRLVIDASSGGLAEGARFSLLRDLHGSQFAVLGSRVLVLGSRFFGPAPGSYTKRAITRWMMALVCNVPRTTSSLLAPRG